MVFNAYSLSELYDKPLRKWLSEKFILNKLKKLESNNKMNYNRINDSVVDNEEEKKKNSLIENENN